VVQEDPVEMLNPVSKANSYGNKKYYQKYFAGKLYLLFPGKYEYKNQYLKNGNYINNLKNFFRHLLECLSEII
jgi:hypothetical protein